MRLGLCSVVFIVLLVLKLCELITISWWWVFAPLMLVVAWWCLLLPLLFIGVFMYKMVQEYKNDKL